LPSNREMLCVMGISVPKRPGTEQCPVDLGVAPPGCGHTGASRLRISPSTRCAVSVPGCGL
jgi:hypothetical protein